MADELVLPARLAEEMIAHCDAGRPNEACGVLAARGAEIVRVFRMTNASHSPVRYSLDPKEQLAVYNTLEAEGWDLGGVFHSHTRTEAYPSPTDVRLATEDVPYVIVSLSEAAAVIRAFRIRKQALGDETGEIEEIPVTILP